jgi:hypothetical protein
VVQLPPLEDDEPGVNAFPPQRLHVLPRNPGDVDGRVRHAQLWNVCHSSDTLD